MSHIRTYLTALAVVVAIASLYAQQRKITPVESDDKKPPQPTLHYYDKHGKLLDEPVLFLAELDTVTPPSSRPVYPLLYAAEGGVNFFDPVMNIFGQKHTSIDVHASLSLHNWLFPTIEVGLGFGKTTPDDNNYTFKVKPSPYVNLGLDYNFLYKSNPDYRVYVGLRAGLSHYRYDVTDITLTPGYWGDRDPFSLTGQSGTAFYGQALAGVQVKIWREWSMGWSARYNFMIHNSVAADTKPWFIPGYGASNRLTATFSVIYTLPLAHGTDKDNKK